MRVIALENRLTPVEAGVKNFTDFQKDMRQKVSFVNGVTWVLAIIIPAFLGITIYVLTQFVIPAAKLILDDYYTRHPHALLKGGDYLMQSEPYSVYAKSTENKSAEMEANYR